MAPCWFLPTEVPYDKMWADDVHWYPLFLAGKTFKGTFWFRDTHMLVKHEVGEVVGQELRLRDESL
jgi:hypothetical protein